MLRTSFQPPTTRVIASSRSFHRLILLLLVAAIPAAGFASGEQTLTAGPPFGYYAQNFSSLGTSAAATLPTGWKVTSDAAPIWETGVGNTAATTQAAGTTGAGVLTGISAGGTYNFCNGVTATANLDRGLGFLNTAGFPTPRSILLGVQNTTGETITSLTISWRYEKYRSGTRAWDWTFFGSPDGATWNAQALGNRSFIADANNTTISNPPQQFAHRVAITDLNIPNNGVYYFRWTLTGVGGSTNGQGLSIDNVELTPGLYYAYDDASDATYNATWANGSNGGFGWGAGWVHTSTGVGAESGFFTGTSTTNGGGGDSNNDGDINTPNLATPFNPTRAFASYHNTGTPSTSAARPFPFTLRVGDQVRVRMDNGNVAGPAIGTVGIALRNAADQDLTQFYFVGGDAEYTVNSLGAAVFMTGMNFTDQGIEVIYTLTSPTAYHVRFQRLSTLGTTFTNTGLLETPGDQGVARLRLFNFLAGSGTAANSTWNTPALIDPLAPKVSSIVRLTPAAVLTNATSVTYRVTFDETMAVASIQHTDFAVSVVSGSIVGAATTGAVQFSPTQWDVTVGTGTGDGVLRLDLLNTAVVTDFAGNRVGDTFNTGETYQIDKTAPTAQTSVRLTPAGPLTNAASVTYRVTFSEDINPAFVDNADFTATVASGSLPGSGVTGNAQVNATTWDVTASTGTGGEGNLRLDVQPPVTLFDMAGNAVAVAFTGGEVYNVDTLAPTVSGIAPVNGAIIDLTYSEGVNVAANNASNYTISGAGQGTVAANPSTAVFLSGTTYRLTWGAGSTINGQPVTVTVGGAVEDTATNPINPGANFGTASALPVELSSFSLE